MYYHVAYPQIDWRKFGGKFVEEKPCHNLSTNSKLNTHDHFAAFLML
jgi:adenylosuccinate lyase